MSHLNHRIWKVLSTICLVLLGLTACVQQKGADAELQYEPCRDILCGEQCTVCGPGNDDCVEPAQLMVCNAEGRCIDGSEVMIQCNPNQCVPGSTYETADGCNTCECPASGLRNEALCSARPCESDRCTPGEQFDADDGCNICRCPQSGLRAEAACTLRECTERCEPGTMFPTEDGCNTCECPDSGVPSEAPCTERACPDPCGESACGDACQPRNSPDLPNDGFAPPQERPARSYQCDIFGQCVIVPDNELHCDDRCFQVACGDPCHRAGDAGADRDPAPGAGGFPGVEICTATGECVWADGVGQTECPSPCDDLACGAVCEPDMSGAPSSGNEAPDDSAGAPVAPPEYRCNVDGDCIEAWNESVLMCE